MNTLQYCNYLILYWLVTYAYFCHMLSKKYPNIYFSIVHEFLYCESWLHVFLKSWQSKSPSLPQQVQTPTPPHPLFTYAHTHSKLQGFNYWHPCLLWLLFFCVIFFLHQGKSHYFSNQSSMPIKIKIVIVLFIAWHACCFSTCGRNRFSNEHM